MQDLEGAFVGELLGGGGGGGEEGVGVVMMMGRGPEDSLGDGPAGDGRGAQDGHGGDDGQLLELRVAQAWAQEADEVDGAYAKTKNMA